MDIALRPNACVRACVRVLMVRVHVLGVVMRVINSVGYICNVLETRQEADIKCMVVDFVEPMVLVE